MTASETQIEWENIAEDDAEVVLVAHAIAEHGIGRPWDDFLPVNAHDVDHLDLVEYARAAVAALRANRTAALSDQPSGWQDISTAPKDREVEVRGIWKLRGDGIVFTHWRPTPSPSSTGGEGE